MAILNVFDPATTAITLERLEKLTPETQPQWGKMNSAQLLAHLNVAYDMAYGKIKTDNNFLVKFMLKAFVKKGVVNEKPYPKNSRTAPVFLISDERDFQKEKEHFIANVKRVQEDGVSHFEGKESDSFGPLTSKEWNNLFYKHLDHHFIQFGI